MGTRGNALYEATNAGQYETVRILLAHGATAYLGVAEEGPESALLRSMFRQDCSTVNALAEQSLCPTCKDDIAQLNLFRTIQCILRCNLPALYDSMSNLTYLLAAVNARQCELYMEQVCYPLCPSLRPAVNILILNCMDRINCVFDNLCCIIKEDYAKDYLERFRAVVQHHRVPVFNPKTPGDAPLGLRLLSRHSTSPLSNNHRRRRLQVRY